MKKESVVPQTKLAPSFEELRLVWGGESPEAVSQSEALFRKMASGADDKEKWQEQFDLLVTFRSIAKFHSGLLTP